MFNRRDISLDPSTLLLNNFYIRNKIFRLTKTICWNTFMLLEVKRNLLTHCIIYFLGSCFITYTE